VKCWIFKGEVFAKPEAEVNAAEFEKGVIADKAIADKAAADKAAAPGKAAAREAPAARPAGQGRVTVRFDEAGKDSLEAVRKRLMASGAFERLAAWVDASLPLAEDPAAAPKPLPIVLRSCRKATSFLADGGVTLCFELLARFEVHLAPLYDTPAELDQAVVGAAMLVAVHLLAHELADRLDVPSRKADEGDVDKLSAFLINSHLADKGFAVEVGDLVARGAVAMIRLSTTRVRNKLLKSAWWKSHYLTNARLRDVMCWLHGGAPKPFAVGRAFIEEDKASKCAKYYERLARPMERKLAKITGGP
jgi:hypothetical protein